jgi:predicted solute-binding protein
MIGRQHAHNTQPFCNYLRRAVRVKNAKALTLNDALLRKDVHMVIICIETKDREIAAR